MEAWGLDRAGIQIDPTLPTGVVRVELTDGQPSYDIVPDRAYDAIDGEQAGRAARAADPAVLVRGTLAARAAASRTAIAWVQTVTAAPVVLDVNLRTPWWDPHRVREALRAAHTVKVNQDELFLVVDERHGFRGDEAEHVHAARTLIADHDLEAVLLTCGAGGARWIDPRHDLRTAAPAPARFVDAVGAGDAFTSMVVAGRLHGWRPEVVLDRAARFASAACGLRGATTEEPEPYRTAARSAGLPGPADDAGERNG
jgi:fructokinase